MIVSLRSTWVTKFVPGKPGYDETVKPCLTKGNKNKKGSLRQDIAYNNHRKLKIEHQNLKAKFKQNAYQKSLLRK
jgi:hypothetical protein